MQEITILRDISYLGPDRAEQMDAYLPSKKFPGPHPAILLIHGGGWRISDKAAPREINIGTTLARHGYAVFSINYLLNEGTHSDDGRLRLSRLAWPQNFYDCKSALRFVRARAKDYNIDPTRLATMGGSAGGHLAMLVGATTQNQMINREGLYVEQSNAVRCVLNFYGIFDLHTSRVSPFEGRPPDEAERHRDAASPVTYFDARTPPIFITHGTADQTIPVEHSRALVRHLEKTGINYCYVEIAGAPHTYHLHPEQLDLEPVVLAFLRKHLGTCPLTNPEPA